ncbi:MAG: alpha/beta hydrolase-fold protein, partial [Pseudomonadota bacterium]
VIVVGIAYDVDYDTFYKLRERDLRPPYNASFGASPQEAARTLGAADKFSAFLRDELIPRIESEYRTEPGDRAIYGHSYGGLYGTYAFLYETDLFNRYLILSPSLWWPWDETKEYWLPTRAKTLQPSETNARVFFASGELEGRIDDLQTQFLGGIEDRLDPSIALQAFVYDDETHRTVFGRGAMDGLRFIYAEE